MLKAPAKQWLYLLVSAALAALAVRVSAAPAPAPAGPAPTVIIAEGEFFTPVKGKGDGWKVTPQDESYASHTYGGMWVSNGALLGAAPDSDGAVATRKIAVPVAGAYRVWSKYQAPPYFNYMHKIEVMQGGRTLFSHVYGKVDAPRFYSFGVGIHKQLWQPWGVDHDAAEGTPETANLAAGEAELRITSLSQPAPAGDRFIDFIVLTTNPADTYRGFPHGISSPFMLEAMDACRVYLRFKNTTVAPAVLNAQTRGHMQPDYGTHAGVFPAKDQPVVPGAWSPWFNVGTILRLGHDEGVWLNIAGAASFDVQVARDPAGRQVVGDMKVNNGEAIVIPIDVAWNPQAKVFTSRERAQQIIDLSKKWRTANGGKKPEKIAYYGAFGDGAAWVHQLKDALGYNTQLPGGYPHIQQDGYYCHTHNPAEIEKFAAGLSPEKRANMHILSFGDEISIGQIKFEDPKNIEGFRAWLAKKGLTKADLGVEPATATLSHSDPKLAWYSTLYNEQVQFGNFAAMTKLAEQLLNKNVLTGANYSPHGEPQYYGPIYQWVDIFKYGGMKAYWAEDYIFSVPESPAIIGWMFATMHCALKYNNQPIHFYVMPHAPGQTHENLHRSMLYAVGGGALDIDSFWVAPAENFTENSIAWGYPESFRVVHESIYDSAEVEAVSVGGKARPARVAIVLSKATDFNERRLRVNPALDAVVRQCDNLAQNDAKPALPQIICRKDQQLLYLELRHAQHGVDLITEDDITEGVNGKDILPGYDVIYFAGEWIDNHATAKLDAWVKKGGVLYATAGLGHLNQFNEPETGLLKLLGLKGVTVQKNAFHLRPLLELPLVKPIDTITLEGGAKVAAIGMKQVLTVDSSSGARVVGQWSDGSAAATVRDYGKGKAIAVGTLAGHSAYKTATRPVAWARGGYKNLYTPLDFDPAAASLALMGVDARSDLPLEVVASNTHVEALVLDNAKGTLVTLVNWGDAAAKGVKITLKLPFKPASARLVSAGKNLPVAYENGTAVFTLDVPEAEYVLLSK